jgi:hypothetical protein
MSPDARLLAPYRPLVAAELRAILGEVALSHAGPLREETDRLLANDTALVAPCVCLFTAEALGGESKAALPLAAALGMLELTAGVFRGLSEPAMNGLEANWGMARTLNAGDAFFVLAQQSALRMQSNEASGARDALAFLDATARALSEDFSEAGARARLLSAAFALGAAAMGAPAGVIGALGDFGAALVSRDGYEQRLAGSGLAEEAQRSLLDLATNLKETGLL